MPPNPPAGFVARGGVWVVLQNALTLSVLIAGPVGHSFDWHWGWRAPGIPLVALAAWLGIGGALALGRSLSPYPRSERATEVVQSGVYAWVRHPLYGCLICGAMGWALLWSSYTAVALAVAHALALLGKAQVEEEWMRERFPDYPAYARRVRRFIPGVW